MCSIEIAAIKIKHGSRIKSWKGQVAQNKKKTLTSYINIIGYRRLVS